MNDRIEGGDKKDANWNLPPETPGAANSAPNGGPPPGGLVDKDDDRTMALLAWALLLAGIVTGIAAVAAVIVAYVRRGSANDVWRSHFDGVVRMFWIWLILTLIGAPLTLVLIGYVLLAVAAIWTAAIGVRGLFRASENRPN